MRHAPLDHTMQCLEVPATLPRISASHDSSSTHSGVAPVSQTNLNRLHRQVIGWICAVEVAAIPTDSS